MLEARRFQRHLIAKFTDRAEESQLPSHHDSHPIGHLFGHRKCVGRHEHSHPLLRASLQEVLHDAHAAGVEAHHRFVEHKHIWIVEERGGKNEPLLHPKRIAFCQIIGEFREFEVVDLGCNPLGSQMPWQAKHVGNKPKKFSPSELVVEAGFIGHIPDVQVRVARVFHHVKAADSHRPTRGPQQSNEHANRCGFTGAVGTE